MLVSRHRIGRYLPEVVHPDTDPVAVAVCRDVLEETGAECVILHGSRGWDEQSDINVIVVHEAASEKTEGDRLAGTVRRIRNEHYRDSPDRQVDIEDWPRVLTPERYVALRRTLNHQVARAAQGGLMFPREPGAAERYRYDGDTSNEWELVTLERLRMAASWGRSAAERDQSWTSRHPSINDTLLGIMSHILLWHSGAAPLSILGVIYPMRSTVEMAWLFRQHDPGWSHQFRSDLEQLEQYAECGCELVVTDPITDMDELWRNLDSDRVALWSRIRELSGYDLESTQPSGA